MSLLDIPELDIILFPKLELKNAYNLALVSKFFYEIFSRDTLWAYYLKRDILDQTIDLFTIAGAKNTYRQCGSGFDIIGYPKSNLTLSYLYHWHVAYIKAVKEKCRFYISWNMWKNCRTLDRIRKGYVNYVKVNIPFINLRMLFLTRMNITVIHESISQLQNLRELSLSYNKLTTLPEAIGTLTSLRGVVLKNNLFESIPNAIYQLTNLVSLTLSNNAIVVIPDNISHLTSLIDLTISSNLVSDISPQLCALTNLEILRLNRNLLESTTYFGFPLRLETLFMSHNKLSYVPETFYGLPKLEYLNLSNNNIQYFSEIDNFPSENLNILVLNHNKLSSLPLNILAYNNFRKLKLLDNPLSKDTKIILRRLAKWDLLYGKIYNY